MIYFVSHCDKPLFMDGCGQLVNSKGFLHDKRKFLDDFVLILGIKGVVHIEQDGKMHDIGENQYLLLFPGLEHSGYKESVGEVSYYWCHFRIFAQYDIYDDEKISKLLGYIRGNSGAAHDYYIIPETGHLLHSERIILQFKQLLDAALQKFYSGYLVHYTLSLLALEITINFVNGYDTPGLSGTYKHITEIAEYIRLHHTEKDLTVASIAAHFNYHPGYISSAFKKYMGISLLNYINRTKINSAKKMLLLSSDSIKKIAEQLGFADEKYFMRVFKRLEGTTPSKFRNAFYRKYLNEM